MDINFNGFGENCATFVASDSITKTGIPVKMTDSGKVTKCSANDVFCGICVGLRDGYAVVQLSGYVNMPTTSKISVGYKNLAAGSDGKIAVYASGREYLVVDSAENYVGFILN